MSPYGEVWNFTRERLSQSYQGLSEDQLRWRAHDKSHNIGEWVYHVAGVECWFGARMGGLTVTDEIARLTEAARADFITDTPFPFHDGDMSVSALDAALAVAAQCVREVMESPSEAQLEMPVETVIGPVVPGVACLWRVAQHAAYHTGQIWMYRFDPRFPS